MMTMMMMMMMMIRRIITGLCRIVRLHILDQIKFDRRPAHMYDGHFHVLLAYDQLFLLFGYFGFPLPFLNDRLDITELSLKGSKIRIEIKKLTHVIILNIPRIMGFSLHRFNKVNIILKTGFQSHIGK